ncbi:hypothetical protein [Desulfonema ishimotonii]|uniref:hypothetical protein n=1 Tax=Desulfonema ishimotonii TaxID=45657 RepID=UPI000F5673E9|nr:hypothetical protein [Desulfonema ishimotonii]
MARLSSPESALRKIEKLYQKIDELYQSVDLIQQLGEKFSRSCRESDQHRETLKSRITRFAALETACDEKLRRLDAVLTRSDREIARMLSAFAGESARVNEALGTFDAERLRLADHRAMTETAVREAVREVRERMAWWAGESDTVFEAIRHRAAQAMDEDRRTIREALDRLTLISDESREEMGYLEENLEAFKARLQQRLALRTDALFEQQNAYQEAANYDILSRFSDESEKLNARAEAEIGLIRDDLAREKEAVGAALSFLEDEKAAVARRHDHIDAETARISQELDNLIREARERVDQSIAEGHGVIAQEVGHMTSFTAEAEKEIRGLKGDIKTFKDRVSEGLEREKETLFKQQNDFQEAASRKLYTRLSDEASRLRLVVEKEVQALLSEKKEIAEMHQGLEDALAQVNRKISSKTTFFTTQLNTLIVNSQREVSRFTDAAKKHLAERLNRLDISAGDHRNELREIREHLQGFAGQIREKLDRDSTKLLQHHAEFQKGLHKKVSDQLDREARNVKAETRKAVDKQVREMTGLQKRFTGDTEARLGEFDEEMAGIKTEIRAALEEEARKNAKVRRHFKKLADTQTAQGNTLPELDARLRAIEEKLEEMQQRRGFFGFGKKE